MPKKKIIRIPILCASIWDRIPMAVGTWDNPLEDEYSEDERKRRLAELQKAIEDGKNNVQQKQSSLASQRERKGSTSVKSDPNPSGGSS